MHRSRSLPLALVRLALVPLALLLAAGGLPACSGPDPEPAPPAAVRGEGVEVEVTVSSMHCEGCEIEIERALEAIDGVKEARAEHESGRVRVWIEDPAAREALVGAVKEAIHGTGRAIDGEDAPPDAK